MPEIPLSNMHNNKWLVISVIIMLVCDIYCTINVAEQRFMREQVRGGVIFLYALVYDMALCCNTIRNVALHLKLVGHPCLREIQS